MKNPLTPIQKINKLKAQIKALNCRLIDGKARNVYALRNKIEALKNDLKIEIENHYWENYLSI
jgi:Txe/YoeB family toxin of Txe-Axe toxin-antitoxin module